MKGSPYAERQAQADRLRQQGLEDAVTFAREDVARAQARLVAALRKAGKAPERKVDRSKLVAALGMLRSEHAGERASAALHVERIRTEIGKQWSELIP